MTCLKTEPTDLFQKYNLILFIYGIILNEPYGKTTKEMPLRFTKQNTNEKN